MPDSDLYRALHLAHVSLALGRVNRVTRHEDGVRPETDTDHVTMLCLVACDLAPPELDRGRVAAFSAVHELREVYGGDTQTLVITPEEAAAKKAREDAAQARLVAELGEGSWVADLLVTYEQQREPEARFVRLMDKVLPNLTHAFNGCVAAKLLTDRGGFIDARARQFQELSREYAEFPGALELLKRSMLLAEVNWSESEAPAPTAGGSLPRTSLTTGSSTTPAARAEDPRPVRFELSPKESAAVREFVARHAHDEQYRGPIGGGIAYVLSPTSVGTAVVVRCGICREECDCTDYDAW